MASTRARIDELWSMHGLDRAPRSLAPDATITARTLGYGELPDSIATDDTVMATDPRPATAPSADRAAPSDAVSNLPLISLAVHGGSEYLASSAVVVTKEGADLEAQRVLGEGGMGRVLLARQRSLARDVAVKVVKREAQSVEVVHALVSEALLTGALEHPNIIPVHALGRDAEGRPLLVMKRIEGTSWRNILRDPAHPMWDALVERTGDKLVASIEVLMSVCNAVHFAHARGVIHRDIKPENVMLGTFGEVYLVDWGIAVRHNEGSSKALVGTPSYMAPEMLDGDVSRVDARTDVYLLGATLHEVLTGAPRHVGNTIYEVILRAYESEPFAFGPEVPSELAALANDSCSKEPADRPASAEVFRQRLADWLRHRGSIELAKATALRARELTRESATEHRATFDRLATECRFGFTEALRQWPDNTVAKEGLVATLRAMVDAELSAENAVGARSLLDELAARGAKDPEREARLAAAERKSREKSDEAARARVMMHELDDRVGLRERSMLLVMISAVAICIMVFITVRGGISQLTVASAARFSVIVMVLVSAGLIAFRRSMLANEFNRRVTAVVLFSVGGMSVHRWVAWARGDTSLPHVLSDDLAMVAAITGLGAVAVRRWFAPVSVLFALSAASIYVLPQFSHIIFAVGPITATIYAFAAQRRDALRDRDASSAHPPSPEEPR